MIPISDWQFWIVTFLALLGAWRGVRSLVPRRGAACGGCSSGDRASSGSEQQATLTLEGKRV